MTITKDIDMALAVCERMLKTRAIAKQIEDSISHMRCDGVMVSAEEAAILWKAQQVAHDIYNRNNVWDVKQYLKTLEEEPKIV